MAKINKHIEIVSSAESSLSSMGKASRDAAAKVLRKYYRTVGITLVTDRRDLEALVAKSPDLVVLGMKFIMNNPESGSDDRKVWLADYLTDRGIATTGSDSTAHRLDINKPLAKDSVSRAGYATSAYYMAKVGEILNENDVPGEYPLFVKPANRGGGLGIDSDSIVHNFSELQNKVSAIAHNLNSDSLIERYLTGREFSVALLKDEIVDDYVAMPLELIAPIGKNGARILSGKVKSADAEQALGVEDRDIQKSIIELAMNAFRSIGGRDYGRIDIRMDEHGQPHFLEANLIPSLIDNYGSFPKACTLNQGIKYEEMMLRIVELGMTRISAVSEASELPIYGDVVHAV